MKGQHDFSLITGPGNHAHYLIKSLQSAFEFDYTEYWPRYKYYSTASGSKSSRFFDAATYLAYGIQSKLNFLTQRKWHQDAVFALYDLINSKTIQGKNLIAWPQVSLYTMRKIKQQGGICLLEHPMCHVDSWVSALESECIRWKIPQAPSFTKRMIDRFKSEYDLADQITVLSSYAKKTFTESGIPENKINVCPLGVNVPTLAERKSNSKLRILYAGRLELLKGVHYLLEAIEPMQKNIELHVAGAVQPDFFVFAKKYEGSFTHHGQLTRLQLFDLYATADLLVFPSLNDSFGLVIAEAMSLGVPVIASTHSAGPDLIQNGVNGFVVNPRSAGEIADRVSWALNHRVELKEMGLQARRKIEENFTYELYANRVVSNVKAFIEKH